MENVDERAKKERAEIAKRVQEAQDSWNDPIKKSAFNKCSNEFKKIREDVVAEWKADKFAGYGLPDAEDFEKDAMAVPTIGTVVRHKSGGPLMTIHKLIPKSIDNGRWVYCAWFSPVTYDLIIREFQFNSLFVASQDEISLVHNTWRTK
jgi:uncharacterized protein YodC (DUF2158 family)